MTYENQQQWEWFAHLTWPSNNYLSLFTCRFTTQDITKYGHQLIWNYWSVDSGDNKMGLMYLDPKDGSTQTLKLLWTGTIGFLYDKLNYGYNRDQCIYAKTEDNNKN